VASVCGSILNRIFQVSAHSVRLTSVHIPGGNRREKTGCSGRSPGPGGREPARYGDPGGASASPHSAASPSTSSSCVKIHDKVGKSHIAIMPAAGTCAADHESDVANGTPPLIWHGGPVMGTRATGPVVVTPIFWSPSNYPMAYSYKPRRRRRDQPREPRDQRGDYRPGHRDRLVRLQWLRESGLGTRVAPSARGSPASARNTSVSSVEPIP
jgi:hypothetical protein